MRHLARYYALADHLSSELLPLGMWSLTEARPPRNVADTELYLELDRSLAHLEESARLIRVKLRELCPAVADVPGYRLDPPTEPMQEPEPRKDRLSRLQRKGRDGEG